MPASDHIVTRFAPSPTGHLHIGGARTALFCWAYARKEGGRFMIRIEDTDQARSSEASARGILDDLAWLGITWDDGPVLRPARGAAVGELSRPVGPYFQAQRLDIYNAYIEHLYNLGRAYPAFETSEELEALRKAALAKKQTFKYPRPADVVPGVRPDARIARAAKGEAHVVRFVMPDTPIHVNDYVLGEVKYAEGEVDDFVIRKADGFPTYHFAVVIDDELMGVTHILRGQEHLNNTPRHVGLQGALTRLKDDRDASAGSTGAKFRTPVYAHMPLIFNMDSSKMSKRDKDKAGREAAKKAGVAAPAALRALGIGPDLISDALYANWLEDTKSQLPAEALRALADKVKINLPEVEVEDFKRAGYLPEVICNFIALLGWSPGGDREKFDQQFLAEHFTLDRIGKTNARFDRVKLLAFNMDAITKMPVPEFTERFRAWCDDYAPGLSALPPALFAMLCQATQARCKTFKDAADQAAFVLQDDDSVVFDARAVEKHLKADGGAGLGVLRDLGARLSDLADFQPATLHALMEAFAAERGLAGQMGKLAQPLRVALTGGTVSPPIDLTLALLGKVRAGHRLERAARLHA